MAWYRLKTCFELGWLTEANRSRAVLVKTFVTTELQRAIADGFGVGIVDTLTGFKYIAGKLRKYEDAIPADKKGDYRSLSEEHNARCGSNTRASSCSAARRVMATSAPTPCATRTPTARP
jgi:phosphomannomutase